MQFPPRGNPHPDQPFWSDGILNGIFVPAPLYDNPILDWMADWRIIRYEEGSPPITSYLRNDRAFQRLCREILAQQLRNVQFRRQRFAQAIPGFTQRLVTEPWAREQYRRYLRQLTLQLVRRGRSLPDGSPLPMT